MWRLAEAQRLRHPLTLVSAKAGSGKTTLVSEWLHQQDRPATWLSLDANDSDPRRFFRYLVAALQVCDAEIGRRALSQLEAPVPHQPDDLVAELINDVASGPTPFFLVLDDYHLIQNEWVHQAVGFLVEHQPPEMHLILVTRVDPPLPLARLRGRGQITEIRDPDLRFTEGEIAQFLNSVMDLDLRDREVSALEARTEGWIAGLQMAAISMQSHRRAGDQTAFIDAFSGTNRFILDYLMEEVLNQQTPAVQDFLIETSILERVCGGLSDAVRWGPSASPGGRVDGSGAAGTPSDSTVRDGQAILAQLERRNLFVMPLSGTVSDPGADTWTLTASIGTVADNGDGTWNWSYTTSDGPDESQDVTITATDTDAGEGTATFALVVNNLPPAIEQVINDGPVTEGSSATIDVKASDPAGASDPLSFEYDCDNDLAYEIGPQPGDTSACSFQDNGSYQVNVRVDDGDGGQTTGSTLVEVTNVAPSVEATGSVTDENGHATVSGSISDPGGGDSFILVIDWGEGEPQEYGYPAGTASFSEQYQYLDDDPSGTPSDDYAIGLTVADDDLGEGSGSAIVTVNNVAPVVSIDSITGQTGRGIVEGDTVLAGLPIEVQGSYSDVGSQDTHTARVDWGDGDDDELGDVTGAASASHAYGLAGDYTLTLSVTDDDTGRARRWKPSG